MNIRRPFSSRFRFVIRGLLTGSSIAACLTDVSHAGSLSWDGSDLATAGAQGGVGTWDSNTTANWWDGAANVVWPNTGTDNDAVFGGTAGTVAIAAGGVTVNDLTFNTTSYILNNGGGIITLNGTPTITTTTGSSEIKAVLAGNIGTLTIAGAGTTIFSATAKTFVGDIVVNSGATLQSGLSSSFAAFIPDASNVTVDGTLRLTCNTGVAETINALNGTGSVFTNHTGTVGVTNTLIVGSAGGSGTFSGVLSNGGDDFLAFTKAGGGTQTLTGVNTYTGATTITGGTLEIGGIGSLGNGAYAGSVVNDATFKYSSSVNQTLSGVLSGAGSLVKGNNLSTLTISGATNTFSGATNINGGTLNLTGTLGSSAITVNAGGILTGTGSTTGNITLSNGSAILLNAAGAVQGADVVASGIVNLFVTGAPTGAPVVRDVIRYTGATPGTGNFAAANYRSGTLTDDTVNKKITLGYQAEAKTWNSTTGGTWAVDTSAPWSGGSDDKFFWGDSVTFAATAADQTVTLTGDLAPSSIAVSNAANKYTFSGTGAIIGAGSLTKTGAGTLEIANSGANTYTGGTTLNGGTLALSGSGKLGSGALTTTSGTLNLGDTTQTVGAVTINGAVTIQDGTLAGTSYTASAGATISANLAGGTATLTKTGTSTLTLSGANTFTGKTILGVSAAEGAYNAINLNTVGADGVSTYAIGGDLQIGTGNSVGYKQVILSRDNQIINTSNVTFSGVSTASNRFVILDFQGVSQTVASISDAGSTAGQALIRGISGTSALTVNQSINTSFGGLISGALSLTKNGIGTLTLTNAGNTYTGATTINEGVLTLSGAGALANTTAITIASGATLNVSSSGNNKLAAASGVSGATLNINGTLNVTTNTAHTLAHTSNYFSTISMNNGTMASTVTNASGFGAFYVGANRTINATGTNTISGTGVIGIGSGFVLTLSPTNASDSINVTGTIGQGASGTAGGLTKAGAGTVTLSGANTYTGATTINAGTLAVTGSLSGSSAVTVNTGGTLGGDGTIGGVTLAVGGTIAPSGTTDRSLTVGNATLNGGTFALDINAATIGAFDQLNATGAVTFGGLVELSISLGYTPAENDTFTIVHAGSMSLGANGFTISGDLLTEGEHFIVSGSELAITYTGGDGNDVVLTAVPEPGAMTAMLGGMAVLLGGRRRRACARQST